VTFPLMRTKVTAISQLPVFPWKLARSTPDRGPSNYAGVLNIWAMSIPCRRVIGRSVDDVKQLSGVSRHSGVSIEFREAGASHLNVPYAAGSRY
jgi:hypothetical protein